jgi:glucokinase
MTLLGVDIGATNTKIGIFDRSGGARRLDSFPTERDPSKEAAAIARWSSELKPSCAGVGIPAPLDCRRDRVLWAVNLGWKNVPFRSILARKLRMPVVIENDANVAAWGEYRCGAARGRRSCVLFTLGTGVGGGIVIDGRLHLGDTGFAAELGHVIVQPGGALCGCGHRGCLEAYASATAFDRRHRELTGRAGPEPRLLFALARRGDRTCLRIVDEAAQALGVAIAGLAHSINPSVAVLSGGISLAGPWFLSRIRRRARELMYKQCALDILLGKLQENAGVIGAALWALERCR